MRNALFAFAAAFMAAGAANATVISLDGQTFDTSPTPAIVGTNGLTFLAQFTTSSQSLDNKSTGHTTTVGIIQLVEDYLATLNINGVLFLGRAGDSEDLPTGVNGVTVAGNNNQLLTGTFTLHLAAGAPDYSAEFVAIHAGEGQSDDLFEITNPDPSQPLLTAQWATDNGHGLSNFDLFGAIQSDPPCTGPDCDPPGIPEPSSFGLFGLGLLGLGAVIARRRNA
jgi:hypothetical protein